MTASIERAKQLYRDEGVVELSRRAVQHGYDSYVRPHLPGQIVSYNGVDVRAGHMGDAYVPWQATTIPNYEGALVNGIRTQTERGDSVVIVGGGWGVSTVVAANQVGDAGSVITYEGAGSWLANVRDTLELNGVDKQVTLRHAVVTGDGNLRDETGESRMIYPDELPDCDVLILDCEGAERNILGEMTATPRQIIVETHGMYDAPKPKVIDILNEGGYRVTSEDIAEDRFERKCIEDGIYVLEAVRDT